MGRVGLTQSGIITEETDMSAGLLVITVMGDRKMHHRASKRGSLAFFMVMLDG